MPHPVHGVNKKVGPPPWPIHPLLDQSRINFQNFESHCVLPPHIHFWRVLSKISKIVLEQGLKGYMNIFFGGDGFAFFFCLHPVLSNFHANIWPDHAEKSISVFLLLAHWKCSIKQLGIAKRSKEYPFFDHEIFAQSSKYLNSFHTLTLINLSKFWVTCIFFMSFHGNQCVMWRLLSTFDVLFDRSCILFWNKILS